MKLRHIPVRPLAQHSRREMEPVDIDVTFSEDDPYCQGEPLNYNLTLTLLK